MKVLHVAESIKGGCGTYLNQIVPLQSAELGPDNVRVLVPRQHAAQIPDVDTAIVHYFDRPARSARSLISLARSLWAAVREHRPDIIHAHSTFAGFVVRILYGWNRAKRAVAYCPHGWVFHTTTQPAGRLLLEAAERLLSPLCDAVVAISHYEAKEGARIGIAPSRIRVVYNGLATAPSAAADCVWDDPRLRVLFVGRLDRQKGFDIACEALRGLEATAQMRAVGEAVHGGRAKPFSIPSNVELLGWRGADEIVGLLEKADIVVMPSRWEGFGLVAAEAMRAGKPVLATSVGGLMEVVEDGVTGMIVPPEDAVAIRDAIRGLDRAKAVEMGVAGRRRFERLFTADRVNRELTELYRDCIRGARGPRTR